MNKKRFFRIIMLCAALVAYGAVRSPAAQAEGGSDKVAKCIVTAYKDAIQCIDDLPWYAQMLCNLRFHSDVIFCTPKFITKL